MNYGYGWNCDTALHQAARENDIELAHFLLKRKGIDINDKGYDDWTPLHCAVQHSNIGMIKMLLDAGANIDALRYGNAPPLHQAITVGDKEIVRYLIDAGADVSIEDDYGKTPFELLQDSGLL